MKNTSILEEPSDNVLYAEKISRYEDKWRLCELCLSQPGESEQSRVLLENVNKVWNIRISRDRANVAAIVKDGEKASLYLLRSADGWAPTKIYEDCEDWNWAWQLSEDGTAVWHYRSGEITLLLQQEQWKKRTFAERTPLLVSDGGRTVSALSEGNIVIWDVWHDWNPYLINVVPPKEAKDYSIHGTRVHAVGGKSASQERVALAWFYRYKSKASRLFLTDHNAGQYSQKMVLENKDTIEVLAVSENNNTAIFSVGKWPDYCSVYGIRRSTGWKPELVFTEGRLVNQVVDTSPNDDFYLLAIAMNKEPHLIYSVCLENNGWKGQPMFSECKSEISHESPLSIKLAPDHSYVAGISWSDGGRILRCMTRDGKIVGSWPVADGKIDFSPDSRWITYLAETQEKSEPNCRKIRRIDGSGEREIYAGFWKWYVGWVKS